MCTTNGMRSLCFIYVFSWDVLAIELKVFHVEYKDHHCVWMNNCVGHANYKIFFIFVMYAAVACIYSLVSWHFGALYTVYDLGMLWLSFVSYIHSIFCCCWHLLIHCLLLCTYGWSSINWISRQLCVLPQPLTSLLSFLQVLLVGSITLESPKDDEESEGSYRVVYVISHEWFLFL